MRKFLLGGFTAAGLLLGGLAITAGTVSAQSQDEEQGDVYSCPEGSTSNYKVDNLTGETYTVPQPTAGKVIVAVIVKASTEHKTYSPVTPGQVLPVKADMGHNISHAHICEGPPPTTTTAATTTTTTTTAPPPPPETPATPAPAPAAPQTEVAAAGPVPPAAAPAAAPPAPAQSALPSTGSSSWGLALTALASLLGGLGLVKLSRRTS